MMMKTVRVVVFERTEIVNHFPLTVPAYNTKVAVQEAIKEVESRGYRVNRGGYNEYCHMGGGQDCIAITVEPEEEPQN